MNTPEHWRPSRQFAALLTGRTARFIRTLAFLIVGFSFYFFGHAAYDEYRGIAAPPYVPARYSRPVEHRATNSAMFRALMHYEWMCPIVFLLGGLIILGIVRRADHCDPFSPCSARSRVCRMEDVLLKPTCRAH